MPGEEEGEGEEGEKRKEATEQQEGAFDVWQFGKKEKKKRERVLFRLLAAVLSFKNVRLC